MFEKMILDGVKLDFLVEILLRTSIMFFLVLLILRISGKRGVRQLTLFEVAIILSLGSAAGDPMFQEDVPVLYAAIVLFVVIILYKIIAWAVSKFHWFNKVMEGEPLIIVLNGQFVIKSEKEGGFSKDEFFAELRNQSVEHLGQVQIGVMETDGTLSLLFYNSEEVRPGLPLFPDKYKAVNDIDPQQIYACMYCGYTDYLQHAKKLCVKCEHKEWTKALQTCRN